MSRERAKKIKLILFDVDGVMTDGGIWLFPAPAGTQELGVQKSQQADKGGYAIHSATMIEAKADTPSIAPL